MKTLFILALSTFLFQGFARNSVGYSISSQNEVPVVQADSTYKVLIKTDIVYAKGLSHESINSESSSEISLILDVYLPDNNGKNRPVIMLIHGGGFAGGTKEHKHIVNMAKYFAGSVSLLLFRAVRGDIRVGYLWPVAVSGNNK